MTGKTREMTNPHSATPSGKPRARALGIVFSGEPGTWNAITDVPGVEVGYVTLVEGDDVRTGVTAIHPRGSADPGDPVAAGFHSQNGNGEMTGVSWIEESGTFSGPIAITNTHAVGIAHAGIIAWTAEHHRRLADAWLLPVAAETWDGYLNDINGHHVTEETGGCRARGRRVGPGRGGLGRWRYRHELLPVQRRLRDSVAPRRTTRPPPTPSASSSKPTSGPGAS